METKLKVPKSSKKYNCELCDYNTSKISQYDRHLLTTKHENAKKRLTNTNNLVPKVPNYICNNCNKNYKHQSSLCKHKKNCIKISEAKENDSLLEYLMKENSELKKDNIELKNMIIDACKNMNSITNSNNNSNNNSNHNSHNKTFNLQLFLNETCKDAMNITDFVDSIKLQLSDLEKVGELGYVKGISNIITSNLKALDVTQRPIHCTDKKREVLYIKDKNKWEKENDDKNTIRKAIKSITIKSQRLIPKFREKHPDCNTSESPFSNQYNNIIIESMGGANYNNKDNEEKIIKNITNSVIIDKELY